MIEDKEMPMPSNLEATEIGVKRPRHNFESGKTGSPSKMFQSKPPYIVGPDGQKR